MHIGVLSDVHGNKPALDAVLTDMPPVDQLVCAGDLVGYNPWPNECTQWAREQDIPTVSGNHDRAAVTETGFRFNGAARAGIEYTREVLDHQSIEWLRSLPARERVADGSVVIVHGHPDDPDRYTFPHEFSERLLETVDGSVLVMGHTHKQAAEQFSSGIVMNPGSVGQPRDGDPRAAYAIVDTEALSVELCRVEYDIDRVAAAIRDVGLPESLADRLYEGR